MGRFGDRLKSFKVFYEAIIAAGIILALIKFPGLLMWLSFLIVVTIPFLFILIILNQKLRDRLTGSRYFSQLPGMSKRHSATVTALAASGYLFLAVIAVDFATSALLPISGLKQIRKTVTTKQEGAGEKGTSTISTSTTVKQSTTVTERSTTTSEASTSTIPNTTISTTTKPTATTNSTNQSSRRQSESRPMKAIKKAKPKPKEKPTTRKTTKTKSATTTKRKTVSPRKTTTTEWSTTTTERVPVVTEPPYTDPPYTEPPYTEPPSTMPPYADPPYELPSTEPPATDWDDSSDTWHNNARNRFKHRRNK